MRGLLGAFAAEAGIVSYRSVRVERRAPLPSEFAATFVVFGALSLLAAAAPRTAAVAGWGIVVATVLNLVDPTNPTGAAVRSRPPLFEPTTPGG